MKGFDHSNLLREDAAQIVADRRTNLQEDGVSNRIQGRMREPMQGVRLSLYGNWDIAWRRNFQA
jgi:hypothetical protein